MQSATWPSREAASSPSGDAADTIDASAAVLAALRAHPLGRDAAIVGVCVADHAGRVVLDTGFGCRLVAEPDGELLPRIC